MLFEKDVIFSNATSTHIPFVHLPVFTSLWALFPLGALSLAAHRRWKEAAYYCCSLALLGAAVACVWDTARSSGYAFLIMLIAVQSKPLSEKSELIFARACLLLSFLWITPSATFLHYLR